ncbi:MAG: hypothetical protein JKX67_11710 [Colwellia sp.]|nr:hypothetical protein [Colwellia sp.]
MLWWFYWSLPCPALAKKGASIVVIETEVIGGGHDDGLYYAMGYCGSAVARSTSLGTKLGLKML